MPSPSRVREESGKMSKSLSCSSKRSATSNPRWTEEHNAIFGEILMEQFLLGNIPNGIPKKDVWEAMTTTLNQRLNTTYSTNIVLTRFKNMKSDFKNIYQLSNKSGWGWDEENHLPVASDEIWDELLQENNTLAHYRRNPFHQYDVFEKICADDIATRNFTCSTRCIGTPLQCPPDEPLGEDNIAHGVDPFLEMHEINIVDNNLEGSQVPETQEHIFGLGVGSIPVYPQPTSSGLNSGNENEVNGSKRTASNESSSRRTRTKVIKEDIQMLVDATNERTRILERESHRHLPFTMSDCMSKLDAMPLLSNEGMLSVLDVLNSDAEKKVIFMSLTGVRLRAWIEHIHTTNSRYHSYPIWLPVNDSV